MWLEQTNGRGCLDQAIYEIQEERGGRSITGIVGSNPAEGRHGCLSVVSVVCCQVEVSASG